MSAEENARHMQAEFNQEVDALLSDLLCDDANFWPRVLRCRQASTKFAGALAGWAHETDPTVQLAERAKQYPQQFENFLFFVFMYRLRQGRGDGSEGIGSGVPSNPVPTDPPFFEARILRLKNSEDGKSEGEV